jgi:serine/threonine protein kinase
VQPLLAGLNAKKLMAELLDDSAPPSMGYDWAAPSPAELSPLLPGYDVESLLGRGGMGAVYLATETRLRRRVALKLLPLELGFRHDFRQRFEREARVLAQLDHPHIVRLYGMGETDDGHLYLVMEYVEGSHLAALLQQALTAPDRPPGRPLIPWPRIAQIIGQLAEALAHAHAQGLIHRDLKPANVLLSRDGSAKLADFGLARTALQNLGVSEKSAFLTQTGQVMGTYDYMAPEQRDGLPSDHRVDIYGLGVLLYQLLTGSLPRGTFEPPSTLTGVGPEVDRLVARALASNPAHRTPTAEGFLAELRACPTQGKRALWNHPHTRTAAALMTVCGLGAVFWTPPLKQPTTSPLATAAQPLESPAPPAPSLRRSFLGHSLRSLPTRPHIFVAESATTVAQYRRFAQETARPDSPAQWLTRVGDPLSSTLTWHQPGRPVTDDQPVVAVSWQDAHDFCHWLTRSALARGDIVPGQEFRLPMAHEWRQAFNAFPSDSKTSPGRQVEEWLHDRMDFNRLWHAAAASSSRENPSQETATATIIKAAGHETGQSERGFRVILDEKTPGLLDLSARLHAVAHAWGGGRDGLPPVQVLATPETVYVDLTRRPDLTSLDPLRGMGLSELWVAPALPLDLSPLDGEPLTALFLGGPVLSLEPLVDCPIERINIGPFSMMPGMERLTPPSLKPLLSKQSLTHLSWRGQQDEPDAGLREFSKLTNFEAWDCTLNSLGFLNGCTVPRVSIQRSVVNWVTSEIKTSGIQSFEDFPEILWPAEQQAQAGHLKSALLIINDLWTKLAKERWFDQEWREIFGRHIRHWTSWRDLGLGPWLQQGAVGPPPGSIEWHGRYFYYLPDDLTRAEAEYLAASWGGHLATLADPEEETWVRTAVLPQSGSAISAHVGAWRASNQEEWRWITGPATTAAASASVPPSSLRGGFLQISSSPDKPWSAEESRSQSRRPTVIEWSHPEEAAVLRALESRLLGAWHAEGVPDFQLLPRGQVGPLRAPDDRWHIVDAVAGTALLSLHYGHNRIAITTTTDPGELKLKLPDGTEQVARRAPQ